MSAHLGLGAGAEFDAVRAMLSRWGPRAEGIGDDAAVLDVPTGSRLVVSTDSTVEGVHFRREWLTPEEIGWRATAAALSDLAAMGAEPIGILLAMTVPRSWRDALPGIADGVGAACEQHRARIVGGDLTDGSGLALAVTVLGHARAPLTRNGARPGDTLYLTGRLGGPGAALAAWNAGREPESAYRKLFARPQARLAAGTWFATNGVRAAIDLSDGLVADLRHLAAASGVRCVVRLEAVPCVTGVGAHEALVSGEEYELLVASPAIDVARFRLAFPELPVTAIGRVESAPSGVGEVVVEEAGRSIAIPRAYDQFAQR